MLPTDEARHEAGAAPGWSESWYFDFATGAGIGGYVHLALHPELRRAWYWACLVEPGHGPVVVRDHDVALPRGAMLEVRADGLWAECVPETPLEHWSLRLEAFGVRLDDPLDAFRGELGERLPVGLDLSWEATVAAHMPAAGACDAAGYVQAGRVYGDVLVGDRRIDLDATGLRVHTWGPATWRRGQWAWAGASTDDGGAFSVTTCGSGAVSGARWRTGGAVEDVSAARLGVDPGEPAGDAPAPVTPLVVGDEGFDVHVVAWAPLAVEHPSGRTIHLWRALCRYEGARTNGSGWAAWMP